LAFFQSQTPLPSPIQIPFPTTWQKTYGGEDHEEANSIQSTGDGGFIVAGETESFGAGEWDVYLLKLDSEGNTKP
jgi:hypothetical protein